MTHSPSHTALAWRKISDGAPKNGTWILIGWYLPGEPPKSKNAWTEARVRWDNDEKAWTDYSVKSWGYEEVQHYEPTHWMPLPPPPPDTEPPQSINSGLLEAAKEVSSFIRSCNGGSRGERINLDRLANLLDTAISNAEKASSIAKAEREMGEA